MTDLDLALTTDPFAGDFGDPGERKLRDKIVRFRNGGARSTGRSLTMLWRDLGPTTYRYCSTCTEAMALSHTDDGKAWERRIHISYHLPID